MSERALILIVEDDAAQRELLKLQLAGAGYDVRVADDAIIGGRSLMEAPPDLMLLDVALPYLDGLEFVEALKANATVPDVPIIFMTGYAEVAGRARGLGAKCLMKPFSADGLLAAVQHELAMRPPRRRAPLGSLSSA